MKYFVVDTNFLRLDFVCRLQASATDERFVFTDTTILETMKTPFWESDARKSFGALGPHLRKILVAKAGGELTRVEIKERKIITIVADIIDPVLTSGFQTLLGEIASGVAGQSIAYVKSQINSAHADLANQQLNATLNEQELRFAVADIKTAFKLPDYRRASDANQKELVRLYGIKQLARKATETALITEGIESGDANKVATSDCFCLRQSIALYLLGWKWAMNGSLPQRPERITNELMDLDQSVIGSYCEGILTRENSVSALREDLLNVLTSDVKLAGIEA